MTRKHFIQIAKDLNTLFNNQTTEEGRQAVKGTIDALCDTFKGINSNFDRDRFIDACIKD